MAATSVRGRHAWVLGIQRIRMGALAGGALSDPGARGWPLARSTGLAFERPDEAMTGYILAKDAWGKGYATEALEAMVDVARRISVERIHALCHPQHRASCRPLEKCGFSRDRSWSKQAEFPNLAPGTLQDVVCYELALKTAGMHSG
jgi:RimJ/RimL family protein N-acetyltransferase